MITFLDTPGHEAFCAMRSRGAKVADIAILVVAADEGIKPQTIEAIQCIQAAKLPMIVAINKIDKPGANPAKAKNDLMKNNILVEEFGGKIPAVETSAKTKQGINDLLETIILTAEVEDLKTDHVKLAQGVVIEANLDSKKGPIATLLVQEGILKIQDIIGTNSSCGKIKILEDFQGNKISEALPSKPVVVMGLNVVPKVGEEFNAFLTAEAAQEFVARQTISDHSSKVAIMTKPNQKTINLIIKADVVGSLEAVETILKSLPNKEIIPLILKQAVGEINEDDIQTAVAGQAQIFGFRVKTNTQAAKLADQKKIDIFTFDVVYDLLQKINELIKNIIESETVRRDLGRLKVLVVFKTDPTRQIVGGRVIEGEFLPKAKIDIIREEKKTGSGKIIGLQKDKKEIDKGKAGEEIGILYEGSAKIKEADVLIAFVEEKRKMDA